jgi:hypothetical protein
MTSQALNLNFIFQTLSLWTDSSQAEKGSLRQKFSDAVSIENLSGRLDEFV